MRTHPETQLALIADFAAELLGQDDLDEILWLIIDRVIKVLNFDDCVIYLLPSGGDHLIQRAAFGPKNPIGREIKNPIEIALGKGIVGTAALIKSVIVVQDATQDPRYLVDDQSRRSEISVPIIFEDRVLGVIDSEHPDPDYYQDWHTQFLTTIANMTAARLSEILRRDQLKTTHAALKAYESTISLQGRTLSPAPSAGDASDQNAFLSRLSHEVKTPLNAIIGMTDLLLEENPTKELIEPLMIIQKAAQGLDTTLSNLLISLSPNAGVETLTDDGYALIPYLRSIIDEATALQSARIDLEAADVPAQIIFRGIAVREILLALLSNALMHSGRDSATLRVALTDWQDGFGLSFQVIDEGTGIPDELREKIFEPFFQVGDFSASENSSKGLGLAVARALSARVEGTLNLIAHQDHHTCFELIVPARLIVQ
jgi:signal transduction histidine kinase